MGVALWGSFLFIFYATKWQVMVSNKFPPNP
jgi:hypothetical protein